MRLGTSSTDEWAWNRGALITYCSNQARNIGNAFLDAKDNYGSVAMQENYVPTDDAISSYSLPLRDTYEYDRLNRLTQANGVQRNTAGTWTSDYSQWYSYDQWGNRAINTGSTWGANINNLSYTINTANNRINGVTYDAAGNVTSDPNEVSTATYDGENRMRNVLKGGSWSYYVYDADGMRVRRIVGGVETWQIYGIEGELIAEYPANGGASSPQKEYGHRDGQVLIVGGCDGVRWLMADHLGTPRIEADVTGSLANMRRHDYLPFGEELLVGMGNGSIRTTGMGYTTDCIRQRFVGYERDSETGLDYAQARYFSSVQGRFTSPDNFVNDTNNAAPQSWNLYSYVRNNPLRYTDPTGKLIYVGTITGKERDELLSMINETYGCTNCASVDNNGYLKVNTSGLNQNVLAAAQFLTDAINDRNYTAIAVSASGRDDVNFAQARKQGVSVGGKTYDAIFIDFKDFNAISGDKEAVRSFKNFAFAHEVAHLYPPPGLLDTVTSKDPTGPVENKINEIRQARGLPLRASYAVTQDSESFGSQWFGPAKINKKTGQIERNQNNGIVVESKKIVNWNLRMTGTVK